MRDLYRFERSTVKRDLLISLGLVLFAVLLGVVLRWRPSLFPYMMVVHSLMDLQVSMMVLMMS